MWVKLMMLIVLFGFVAGGWIMLLYQQQSGIPVAPNRGDYVRLHILANSDSVEDQQIKLKVRDAVVAYLTPYVKDVSDAETAKNIIAGHRDDIILIARETLAANGADYPVTVQMGTFEFPVRSYGSLVLPAGDYQAVRILLGKAAGQNWWCVLFPPLCFIEGTNTALAPVSATKEGAAERSETIVPEVRWKLVELFNK
ncbi:hypothetical protein SCACP_15350 [Sporomusa carbonis]|uniref:stage II sporulation protein R n=1 Tax=Sporomusa carbonis TaxID=3076075 RepID=UPI003A69C8C2